MVIKIQWTFDITTRAEFYKKNLIYDQIYEYSGTY